MRDKEQQQGRKPDQDKPEHNMQPGFKDTEDHDPHSNRQLEQDEKEDGRHVPGAAHAGSDAEAEEDNNP